MKPLHLLLFSFGLAAFSALVSVSGEQSQCWSDRMTCLDRCANRPTGRCDMEIFNCRAGCNNSCQWEFDQCASVHPLNVPHGATATAAAVLVGDRYDDCQSEFNGCNQYCEDSDCSSDCYALKSKCLRGPNDDDTVHVLPVDRSGYELCDHMRDECMMDCTGDFGCINGCGIRRRECYKRVDSSNVAASLGAAVKNQLASGDARPHPTQNFKAEVNASRMRQISSVDPKQACADAYHACIDWCGYSGGPPCESSCLDAYKACSEAAGPAPGGKATFAAATISPILKASKDFDVYNCMLRCHDSLNTCNSITGDTEGCDQQFGICFDQCKSSDSSVVGGSAPQPPQDVDRDPYEICSSMYDNCTSDCDDQFGCISDCGVRQRECYRDVDERNGGPTSLGVIVKDQLATSRRGPMMTLLNKLQARPAVVNKA